MGVGWNLQCRRLCRRDPRSPGAESDTLAVWIESKSPSVGGRKIRRGVTIGIKWRIERLRRNCSGLGEDENAQCLHAALRQCTTQRSVFGFAGSTGKALGTPNILTSYCARSQGSFNLPRSSNISIFVFDGVRWVHLSLVRPTTRVRA
jgi:hypothetical protein